MKNYKRNILLYDHFCGPGHEILHADALYSLPVWLEW